MARPFLKWAGGKGQLIRQYEPFFPKSFVNYHEPFLGGGAVFFSLVPRLHGKVFLSDVNEELINTYVVVRDNVEELISRLQEHQLSVGESYYYMIRETNPSGLSPVDRAARLIFLNKTCFNGLYRVNRKGKFNVPYGRYKNPKICDEQNLQLCSEALKGVDLRVSDFNSVLERVQGGDFVYFDPPYVPINKTASFTDYTKESFGGKEQEQLAKVFHQLAARGCKGMLSNSATDLVDRLYDDELKLERVKPVKAVRAINSKGDRRGPVSEVLVLNYDPE